MPGTNATWQSPLGGLRISALDLCRVVRMCMNGGEFRGERLLKAATVGLMFKPAWIYDSAAQNGDTWDWSRGVGPRGADAQERPGGGRPVAARGDGPPSVGPPR